MGRLWKKVILMFFSGNDPICHPQKFQPFTDPHSHFLPISPRFLTNIRCRYFSLNIWVVYDQLELDWCIFDQNWAKTRPLHFQIFQILNAIDRHMVHWDFNGGLASWIKNISDFHWKHRPRPKKSETLYPAPKTWYMTPFSCIWENVWADFVSPLL